MDRMASWKSRVGSDPAAGASLSVWTVEALIAEGGSIFSGLVGVDVVGPCSITDQNSTCDPTAQRVQSLKTFKGKTVGVN